MVTGGCEMYNRERTISTTLWEGLVFATSEGLVVGAGQLW